MTTEVPIVEIKKTLLEMEKEIMIMCGNDTDKQEMYFRVQPDCLEYCTVLNELEDMYLYYSDPNHIQSIFDIICVPKKSLLELMIAARRLQPYPMKREIPKRICEPEPYKSTNRRIKRNKSYHNNINNINNNNNNNNNNNSVYIVKNDSNDSSVVEIDSINDDILADSITNTIVYPIIDTDIVLTTDDDGDDIPDWRSSDVVLYPSGSYANYGSDYLLAHSDDFN